MEHTELKEKDGSVERRPEIANAATGAKRKATIESLKQEDPMLWSQLEAAMRQHDGIGHFLGKQRTIFRFAAEENQLFCCLR